MDGLIILEKEFSDEELHVLNSLSIQQELTRVQTLRQALRMYQAVATGHSRVVPVRGPELDFRPLGDNHHNAAKCPHCNPELIGMNAERHELRETVRTLQAALIEAAGENRVLQARLIADAVERMPEDSTLIKTEKLEGLKQDLNRVRQAAFDARLMTLISPVCFGDAQIMENTLREIKEILDAALIQQ